MNHPIPQPGTPLDFEALRRHADMPFDALDGFDEIYFIGDHTGSFALRARAIATALPQFAGVAVFSVSPEKRTRIAQQLPVRQNWRFIELGELVTRAAAKRVLVIDFNDNLTGKAIAATLAAQGVTVRDCLFAMHQLDHVHTYQTVKEERAHVLAHLDRFIALAPRFGDPVSRATLFARLQAWLTLDRRPLIAVAFPGSDFINNFSNTAGLVVGADEVFVDAGAAHGDTVSHVFDRTGGSFRAMHAFEPDSNNFASLQQLCKRLPGTHAYFAGLGEKEAEVDFYECPTNRFGSNFTGKGAQVKTTMRIQTIDATVDAATLVKIDVEGWEAQVIKGGARVIRDCKPNLTVSAYHYAKDIPELLATVDEIARYEHVALRHYSPSLYDTQLVFSDRQHFG